MKFNDLPEDIRESGFARCLAAARRAAAHLANCRLSNIEDLDLGLADDAVGEVMHRMLQLDYVVERGGCERVLHVQIEDRVFPATDWVCGVVLRNRFNDIYSSERQGVIRERRYAERSKVVREELAASGSVLRAGDHFADKTQCKNQCRNARIKNASELRPKERGSSDSDNLEQIRALNTPQNWSKIHGIGSERPCKFGGVSVDLIEKISAAESPLNEAARIVAWAYKRRERDLKEMEIDDVEVDLLVNFLTTFFAGLSAEEFLCEMPEYLREYCLKRVFGLSRENARTDDRCGKVLDQELVAYVRERFNEPPAQRSTESTVPTKMSEPIPFMSDAEIAKLNERGREIRSALAEMPRDDARVWQMENAYRDGYIKGTANELGITEQQARDAWKRADLIITRIIEKYK